MRSVQHILFSAIAVVCLTAVSQAAPTMIVGTRNLMPGVPGQEVPLYVTGIEPNTVVGIIFAVMIDGGGPAYGGTLGPVITAMDFDSGPTIWNPPNAAGHNPPNVFFDGQYADADFLLTSGFVTAGSGLVVTLTIDMTGFGLGDHTLDLVGAAFESHSLNSTDFVGQNFVSHIENGLIHQVPEPSSLILGWFALASLIGLVAWRRKR